jgi:catalase
VTAHALHEHASIRARRVAALAADGVDGDALAAVARALAARGANVQVVAPRPGPLAAADGSRVHVDMSLITTRSLPFDAVFVPGGERSVRDLKWDPRAWVFLTEACERGKAILAVGLGVNLFELDDAPEDDRRGVRAERGLVLAREGVCEAATRAFIAAIAGEGVARARRVPELAVALL